MAQDKALGLSTKVSDDPLLETEGDSLNLLRRVRNQYVAKVVHLTGLRKTRGLGFYVDAVAALDRLIGGDDGKNAQSDAPPNSTEVVQ